MGDRLTPIISEASQPGTRRLLLPQTQHAIMPMGSRIVYLRYQRMR
ncbi:hypothetical protein OG563_08540 [Nocardia vinacea]|uniref:Uncharacterized protein n=1 Tax=Nocardia vinacea TaxID=96468 RepID=A0ABZ1Z2L4_9NOCA|nr:hypothetical protein [Nocardia vinacea]